MYSILELTPDASLDEVKKKYRQLSLKYHPDKCGNDTKFKEIVEAYTSICDTYNTIPDTDVEIPVNLSLEEGGSTG